MTNIKLNYRYRNCDNHRNNGEAVFANPNNHSLEKVDAFLRTYLLDRSWFYASRWGIKDLHFDEEDDEYYHPYHEFINVELTEGLATEEMNVTELVARIRKAPRDGRRR